MSSDSLLPCLVLIAILLAVSEPASGGLTQAVSSFGTTVSNLTRSVDFFSRVLDVVQVATIEIADNDYGRLLGVPDAHIRTARLRLGDECFDLTEFLTPPGRPIPADSRGNDGWFQHIAIVVRDMDAAYARLRRFDVRHVSSGPQTLPTSNPAAGGIRAFYFNDPDHHVLELIQFPPDTGNPKWRQPTDRLFLGIDHSAIVVADTAASLRFYRDLLGMRMVGESENFGTEQERLSNVPGAHLRITSLRAPQGPGIEFLQYLAPETGRPFPADTRASDLWHWQTTLRVTDLHAAGDALRAEGSHFISPGAVAVSDARPGFSEGVLARDPDGHAVLLCTS